MTRFHKASPDLRKVSPTVGSLPPCGGGLGRGVSHESMRTLGFEHALDIAPI